MTSCVLNNFISYMQLCIYNKISPGSVGNRTLNFLVARHSNILPMKQSTCNLNIKIFAIILCRTPSNERMRNAEAASFATFQIEILGYKIWTPGGLSQFNDSKCLSPSALQSAQLSPRYFPAHHLEEAPPLEQHSSRPHQGEPLKYSV